MNGSANLSAGPQAVGRQTLTLFTCIGFASFALGWLVQGMVGTTRNPADSSATPSSHATATQAAEPATPHTAVAEQSPRPSPPAGAADLALLLRERDALRREFAIGEWLRTLRADQFPTALAQLRALPESSARATALSMFFTHWGGIDGPAAIAAARSPERPDAIPVDALKGWAAAHPEAAFEWLAAQPAANRGDMLSTPYVDFTDALLAADRLDEAATFARRITDDTSMFPLYRVAEAMSRRDPGAALQWYDSLPAGKSKLGVFNAVVGGIAESDPELALQTALTGTELNQRKSAVLTATMSWARRDPLPAVAWLAARASDPQFDQARATLVVNHGAEQIEVVDRLLPGIFEEKARNSALNGFATTLAKKDPARASSYVLQYASAAGAGDILGRVVTTWAGKDPAAANAFVAQDPRLTAEQRAVLAKTLTPKPKS